MANFTIIVVSDNVCPWCYIGRMKLDRAIDLYKKTLPGRERGQLHRVLVRLLAGRDGPTQSGVPILQRFAQRSGHSAERAAAFQERLRNIGAQEGIGFSFAGKTEMWYSNTG
ncbi:thioredoxin-like protein [Achaetomium macrosporum]|uniref:Thioredoxin-like protein n=1 Tax=Achaetomium macrosporum TaxID=79813 RepID=A0AAN7H7K5_9PEZI|nr:thioredoxin-like protein [Achaetomium macrosporum]